MFEYESKKAVVCKFGDFFNVYRRTNAGYLRYVDKFKTLDDALVFVKRLEVDTF